MSKRKNIKFKDVKFSAVALALAVIGIFGFDTILDLNNTCPTLFVIIEICFIVIIAIQLDFLLYLQTDPKIDKSFRWRHSVLIIDNKSSDLKSIIDQLSGNDFDVVTLTLQDIADYRIADGYEMIISDIYGLGAVRRNAQSLLNTIKNKYPYKIVIAMTSSPGTCNDLIVDKIISKENKEQFPKDIERAIRDYSGTLDKFDEHWIKTQGILEGNNVTKTHIELLKEDYYNFIYRKFTSVR